MPITCESPRNAASPETQNDVIAGSIRSQMLKTRIVQYAMEIAEVARERGFDADWGRIRDAFFAEVFEISEADFSAILEIASKRLTP